MNLTTVLFEMLFEPLEVVADRLFDLLRKHGRRYLEKQFADALYANGNARAFGRVREIVPDLHLERLVRRNVERLLRFVAHHFPFGRVRLAGEGPDVLNLRSLPEQARSLRERSCDRRVPERVRLWIEYQFGHMRAWTLNYYLNFDVYRHFIDFAPVMGSAGIGQPRES